MKTFNQIVLALGGGNGPWSIGDHPPLLVTRNAGGGGFQASLVFALNAGVHITIYQNSWDGQFAIHDATGGQADVGPYCLHLTAGQQRWFRQYRGNSWTWVTDHGTPNARVVRAFDVFFNITQPYLA